jgi:hypothetical protein
VTEDDRDGAREAGATPSPNAVATLPARALPPRAATALGVGPHAATLPMGPPPPPARTPQWGEIQLATNAPTVREEVDELEPDPPEVPKPPPIQHASPERIAEIGALLRHSQPLRPSVRPPAPEPTPSAKPRDGQEKAPSRGWGEVDLDGVSSAIARPVALDSSRPPPPNALETDKTVRDAPAPVVLPSLPLLPEGNVYYCETCRQYIDPSRVVAMSTSEGRVALPTCPVCGRFVRAEPSVVARSLDSVLLEAVLWPFSRDVAPTLVGHALVFWLLSSLWLFRNPLVTPIVLAAALGVLATYAAAIIRSTSRGDDQAPPPSDAIATWDVAGAVLRHSAVFLVGGAPLLYAIVSSAVGEWGPTERTVVVVLGAIAFCLYVPAGQIVASTRETFLAAVNPIVPIRFAWRVGGSYFLTSAILFAFALAHLVCVGIVMALAGAILGTGFVSGLIWGLCISPVVVGGVLIEARMLGLVVREHRFDLSLL